MKSTGSQYSQSKRILAIHGFTGEPFDFAPLYEAGELEVDWRFVSLPGHQREWKVSNCSTDMWSHFCARIDEIVREAKEDSVDLIGLGYSMGARLLLRAQLEQHWDFSRLILVGVTPGIEAVSARRERLQQDRKWIDLLHDSGIEAFVEAWVQQPIIATQSKGNSLEHESRMARKRLLNPNCLGNVMQEFSNGKLEPVWDRLDQLGLPVNLVHGERDAKFGKIHESMQQKLSNARCHVIPEAGHAPHLENMVAFLNVVAGILNDP